MEVCQQGKDVESVIVADKEALSRGMPVRIEQGAFVE